MTDQELDALMKRVLIDSMKLDLEADGAGQTASFAPSPQHRRQMKAMLKDPLGWSRRKARPVWKMIAQKAAVVLLVISIGFGAVMVASPTAQATFMRWVREWYETHVVYRYTGENLSGEMPRFEITELPEGFAESKCVELPEMTTITYENEAGDVIDFNYIFISQGGATSFVTDDSEIFDIEVNHMSGQFFKSKIPGYFNTITWIDEEANIQFIVDAYLGREDILRIAESVALKKSEK